MSPNTDGLVEREREVSELDHLLDGLLDGEGRLALIEGPAGIGKSRLLAEARRAAVAPGRDLTVLYARGSELEREFPFGVVRQLFENAIAGPEERRRLLGGAAAAAQVVFAQVGDAQTEDDGGAFAALHGLYWLTLNLSADRPLVLAVDDLHWVDRPSLRFIAYLVRRIEGLPVLIAATLRTNEPGTDPALLQELAADLSTTSVRPGPLSAQASAKLVAQALGDATAPEFAAACHKATGGNPLLLRQLLRALETEQIAPVKANAKTVRNIGAGAVVRTVGLRLARLSPDAISVARAVAVLGDAAAVTAVASVAELEERAVAEATGALVRGEILRADPPLDFVHPLVRDAVYHELTAAQRELWHERAARVLHEAGAVRAQVAAQLLAVAPKGEAWVSELLVDAGRDAIRRGAADSAIAYFERALAEPPPPGHRPQVTLELGLAEALASGPKAVEHLREAHATLTDPELRAFAADVLAKTLIFTGRRDEAATIVHAAVDELPEHLEDRRRALLALGGVATTWGSGEPNEELPALAHRPPEPGVTGPGAHMLSVMQAFARVCGTDFPADEVARTVLDATADGTLVETDDGLFTVVGILILAVCDRDEALQLVEASLARAHRRGSAFGVLGVDLWHGFAMLRRGELADAEQSLRRALENLQRWGAPAGGDVYCHGLVALALLDQGEREAAREFLATAPPDAQSLDGQRLLRVAEMELLLADGRWDEAVALADAVAADQAYATNPAMWTWRAPKALALARLGRGEEALELAGEDVALAERFGAPGAIGRALRVRGTVRMAGRGEGADAFDAAIADFERAVEVLDGTPARLELAKALGALGAALRPSRRASDARDPLRRSLELADACGARPLADDVRSELYAAGSRPRTAALSGATALTASERRVAALAAEGVTNREIAQSLFVTPKTVEVHLSAAYRKLGIRSRRELVGALG